jgi:hypothetical protein
MDLEKVTAKIRPRKGWEAIDLGISLVQLHAKVLYKIWFLVCLPLFLIISLTLYSSPEWAAFVMWWLKPILERPMLHFLSRELFGESLSVKQCVKSFFSLAKIQWFASLTWRRLSFTRSLDLPLIQLEGLSGTKRSTRLKTLHSGDSGSAVWLTIVFVMVEMITYLSILALIYLLVPSVYLEKLELFEWFSGNNEHLLMSHLLNIIALIGMSLVAPFYIACGFALYLNQRTHLEAWDIELSFKRLAARLKEKSENITIRLATITIAALLLFSFSFVPANLRAEDVDQQITIESVEQDIRTKLDQLAKKEPAIIEKEGLTHQQVKKLITEIKQGEDFHQKEKKETNQYRGSDGDSWFDSDDDPSSISPVWLTFAQIMALLVEFALWIFVAVLVVFLVTKYKHLLGNTSFTKKVKKTRPKKLFGLDLSTDSLPERPWEVAQKLVEQEKFRQALSLLYRASLIWYIDNKNVLIKEGYTELECLNQIVKKVDSASQGYIKKLTNTWRGLAYAHLPPEKSLLLGLCADWPKVMRVTNIKQSKHSDSIDNGTAVKSDN